MVLIEGVEFSASLKRLIHILHTRSSIPDTNYFRNYLFLFQDVEDEFIRHDTDLTRIFQESATQTMEKDQVVHLLQFPSYIQLMNKLNMVHSYIDETFHVHYPYSTLKHIRYTWLQINIQFVASLK